MKHVFTSESVTEGHPDKVADQISDAVLDAILARDADARVACETLVTTGMAVVAGEITTSAYVHIPDIVRDTIERIGYTDAHYRVRLPHLRGDFVHRPPVARHRARCRRQPRRPGRRRPGDDVRLRHRRNTRADAAADRAGASPGGAAGRGAPRRRRRAALRLAPPRRQDAGVGRVRGRPPGRRARGGGVDPARRARRQADARRTRRSSRR